MITPKVSNQRLGALRRQARVIGITIEYYLRQMAEGKCYCRVCKEFLSRKDFSRIKPGRGTGMCNGCNDTGKLGSLPPRPETVSSNAWVSWHRAARDLGMDAETYVRHKLGGMTFCIKCLQWFLEEDSRVLRPHLKRIQYCPTCLGDMQDGRGRPPKETTS